MRYLIFFLVFGVAQYCFAQKYVGVLVGVNSSNTTNVTNANDGVNGFAIGGFIGANKNEKNSGVMEFTARTVGFSTVNGNVRMYYANIATLMGFQVGSNPKFRVIGGLQPNLFLGKKEPEQPNRKVPIYCNEDDCFETPRPLSVDAIGGLEFWGKTRVSLRFGIGLLGNLRFRNNFIELALGI